MELFKNQELIVTIDNLGYQGEGVCKEFEKPIFVPFALPGEIVKIHIILVKKDFAIGKLIEIIKTSTNRIEPPCPVFTKCGGCQLQHLKYDEQLKFKINHLEDCLRKIAKVNYKVTQVFDSPNVYNYRNKLSMPIGNQQNETKIGMYANNSHRIIPIDNCLITKEFNIKLIKCVKEFVSKFKISIYDEEHKKGILRHIVAREVCNKLNITVVVNHSDLPYKNEFIKILKNNFENFEFFVNINKVHNNVIFGNVFKKEYGEETIDNFLDIKTIIHPNSFYQVNNEVKEKFYNKIISVVESYNNYTIIDAYSGAGMMSNVIAKFLKINNRKEKVYGIEIISEAVKEANTSAKQNNIDDVVTHIEGDCAEVFPKILTKNKNSLVILDPPRKGCDEKVLNAIISNKIEKVIYMSCDPSTLARDIKLLKENYNIDELIMGDMFPQTKHIEALAILSKI